MPTETEDTPVLKLLEVMSRLRDPQSGCPWDIAQDFSTIAPYTIEEAYEVADAIQRGCMDELKDELGDLLLQVVFHAQMAEEQGLFAFDDVADAISEKMIRRHPHVFADQTVESAEAQTRAWEEAKAQEREAKGADSLLDDVPRGMAELQRAVKLQKRAAIVGFDWTEPEPILEKLKEEASELREAMAKGASDEIEDELGDLLFVVTNLARRTRVDPAKALRRANAKFESRFREVEKLAGNRKALDAMSLDEMEALWQQAKHIERAAGQQQEFEE